MKKIFFILVIILFPVVLFSASKKKQSSSDLIFQVEEDDSSKQKNNSNGPFGLKMGMTLSQISKACNNMRPKQIEGDKYYVYPVKTHPLFKSYIAFVDENEGLYCLQAETDQIHTRDYGIEVKDAFSEIKDRVSKTYGEPKMIDKIDPKSWLTSDSSWLLAVGNGARIYAAIWDYNLVDDLERVSINVSANHIWYYGIVTLEYDFKNKLIVEDLQDDVF